MLLVCAALLNHKIHLAIHHEIERLTLLTTLENLSPLIIVFDCHFVMDVFLYRVRQPLKVSHMVKIRYLILLPVVLVGSCLLY